MQLLSHIAISAIFATVELRSDSRQAGTAGNASALGVCHVKEQVYAFP